MTTARLFMGIALVHVFCSADDVPPWLREASTHAIPPLDARVSAVVLLQEAHATIQEAGRTTTMTRKAIRILARGGQREAHGAQVYVAGSSKVREIRGWVIEPSGRVLKLGAQETFDRAYPGDLYNEIRERGIDGQSKSEAGSIFGYEITTEDNSVFSQFDWHFQGNLPTLVSRYTLTIPRGWQARGLVYNAGSLSPSVRDSTYIWELQNLPPIDLEPSSPTLSSIVPRLAVSYFPEPGGSSGPMRTFASWNDVSRWLTELSDPQVTVTPEMAAKARELIATGKTELQRIQSIGRFVQNTQYISIQTGIGRGGGYRPHSAPDIFTRQYGDCKDKATLMRAMLKAIGVESYAVSVYSADRSYVREDFPSPQQFNHAIVAIKVSAETQAYTAVDHQVLGRLLFFDPTSGEMAGSLPPNEQGSLVLVSAGENGVLLRLPVSPPKSNIIELRSEATLAEDGRLSATTLNGRPWQNHNMQAGQLKNNRLLVLQAPFLNRPYVPHLTAPTRKYPVLLYPSASRETVKVRLPIGFKIDEIPDRLTLETPFGRYAASCSAGSGEVVCSREYELHFATIPVEQYSAVREFFQQIQTAEQTPIVLVRQ